MLKAAALTITPNKTSVIAASHVPSLQRSFPTAMVRRTPSAGTAPVYDISSRQIAPLSATLSIGARATAAQKRAYRKQQLANTETQLLQDFEFPTLSHRIKVTPDGDYILACGVYPPQLHVYDVHELSLKYKRHVNTDIVDFQILEQSYTKFALLTAERGIELHTPFGKHFETRVPRFGRDLMLHKGTAELFIVGDGREAWRLNLHQGRFLAPVETVSGKGGGNNVCGISTVNSLLYFGGENATVDVWDSRIIARAKEPAGVLDVYDALCAHDSVTRRLMGGSRPEITALRCDESDGVSFSVGTANGFVTLFDLRMAGAVSVRDHGNGMPIRSIRLHDDGTHVLSADTKSIKVWKRDGGDVLVAIEPDADVNHLCVVGSSGVLFAAVEAPRVKTFYVPALGNAPKWCAFLDNFTEELEGGRKIRTDAHGLDEDEEEVYENYKFVSAEELEGLGLNHLVGTDMLRAYMHGYFVHQKLYRRAVEVSEPFAYEKYRREKAREKMEAERESRIAKKTKKTRVKVNQNVVEALQKGKGKKNKVDLSVLEDERFSAMFSNKDYAVDEEAERFQHLNPSGTPKQMAQWERDEDDSDEEYLEQFELVDDGGEDTAKSGDNTTGEILSSDESDESVSSDDYEEDIDEESSIVKLRKPREQSKRNKAGSRRPKMYELGQVAALSGNADLRGRVSGMAAKRIREEVSLGARLKNETVPDAKDVKGRSRRGGKINKGNRTRENG